MGIELVFDLGGRCAVIKGLLHVLGVDDVSGRWYAWWSGAGSDLSILAAPGIWWRTHNCHIGRCWRLARHPVDGTALKVCRRHHPDDHPTAQDVAKGASA